MFRDLSFSFHYLLANLLKKLKYFQNKNCFKIHDININKNKNFTFDKFYIEIFRTSFHLTIYTYTLIF